jgi:ornithine cyclodeaminase/alanine dehydrogenase-like protein (mu-crystallin family)
LNLLEKKGNKPMKIRILTADDVQAALPMDRAIGVIGRAFSQFSAGKATVPLRTRVHTEKGVTLLMPAFLQESRDLAVKVVSVYGDNPKRGLPTVTATVLVLDAETGLPLSVMDGDSLTAIRTGAAGGLAAKLLSRADARTVALFGAGVQARSQLQAACAVRAIERVYLVEPNDTVAQRLVEAVGTWKAGPEVIREPDPDKAVAGVDIVLAATTTRTPLFDGHALRPGTHVTGVGSFTPEMQEIDAVTVGRARVVVDSRDACRAEAGDIIAANADIDAEIGEIVNGKKPGRIDETEITFFKSVGIAAQDAVTSAAVLAEAEKQNLGTVIAMH